MEGVKIRKRGVESQKPNEENLSRKRECPAITMHYRSSK